MIIWRTKQSATTISIMTLILTALGVMTLCKKALSIIKLKTILRRTLTHHDEDQNNIKQYNSY